LANFGFIKKLFKNGESDKEAVDVKKSTKEAPSDLKSKVQIEPIKGKIKADKDAYTPEIQKEEFKIANKIAKEFTKTTSKEKLESEKKSSIPTEISQNFYRTGIPGFDVLLGQGGITIPSSVLIEGGPGSGKTIFCLHVAMDFCKRGKKVLYMTFEESEERLAEHISSFGFDAQKYIDNGQLNIRRFNALDIARSVEALLSEAKKELLIEVQPILIPQEINPDLVLVDSLTSIASAFSGEDSRFRIYMEQLFRYLEEHKISALLIREVANPGHVGGSAGARSDEATSFLSDGIIIFYNVIYDSGTRKRAVEILKLRGQAFERKIVEAEILRGVGLKISPEKVLKGKYKLT
jgi:circadian clock protein KaiC